MRWFYRQGGGGFRGCGDGRGHTIQSGVWPSWGGVCPANKSMSTLQKQTQAKFTRAIQGAGWNCVASGTKLCGAPTGTPSTGLSGRNSFYETGRSSFYGSGYGGLESFLKVWILKNAALEGFPPLPPRPGGGMGSRRQRSWRGPNSTPRRRGDGGSPKPHTFNPRILQTRRRRQP